MIVASAIKDFGHILPVEKSSSVNV